MKKAFITGITGQDGSYLAELLLKKGYEVHGLIRRSSSFNTGRLSDIYQDPHEDSRNLVLHHGDLSDASTISKLLNEILPDEVYNLAAQSHVRVSFDLPEYTADISALGTTRILEEIKNIYLRTNKKIKFYQAGSSEMFGKVKEIPQTENTPFYPRSPYGCAKVYSFWLTKNYREAYGLFACNGILFNHESPRRGETFVTRKITRAVARIKEEIQEVLYLGNLDAKRDWGFAGDYVEAMWLIMQEDKPEDFVIATNETHTVREFLERCFEMAGIPIESNGKKGTEEEYLRKDNKKTVVKIDPNYFRPTEVDILIGDYSKAKKILGWKPKIKFKELAKIMLDHDILETKRELYGTKNS